MIDSIYLVVYIYRDEFGETEGENRKYLITGPPAICPNAALLWQN